MAPDSDQVGWAQIWRIIRGSNKVARRRALRETLTVVAVSLLPLLLGAFFIYVEAVRAHKPDANYFALATKATMAGQLFLLFLSLAGTIFARLWDPEGPRYAFSSGMNIICFIGAAVSAGLIAIDENMGSFSFWPVGALSLAFFLCAITYYFFLAIPSYIEKPDIQGNLNAEGSSLSSQLEIRMGGDAS